MQISGTVVSPQNLYLYNKKELQPEIKEYDYGARFYDPVIARFTTIDPMADKMRLVSPYAYVYNNPISLIDENGKWPKWIHHRIIREAFKGILSQHQIDKLIEASDKTDAPENQTANNDRKHNMRMPGQSPEQAEADAEEFITDQQDNYIKATTDDEALLELGAGMHTLMDGTSPAHKGKKGPKVWAGNFGSNIVFAFYHFWAESNIFHLSEKRVKQAEDDIRNYYFVSQKKKVTATVTVGSLERTPGTVPDPTPPPPPPNHSPPQ